MGLVTLSHYHTITEPMSQIWGIEKGVNSQGTESEKATGDVQTLYRLLTNMLYIVRVPLRVRPGVR
jgi:hypothetical protein